MKTLEIKIIKNTWRAGKSNGINRKTTID